MGERIAVRILGLASTTRGFAFALTEGPGCLVNCGVRRTPVSTTKNKKAVDAVLQSAKPLFLAFEQEASRKKRHRGRMFAKVVTTACLDHKIMVLDVESKQTKSLADGPRPTKWAVAEALARRFPEIAHKLPAPRKAWQSEDDRIGLFMALAAAVSIWDSFKGRRR